MKAYTKEFIKESEKITLEKIREDLNRAINKGRIEWVNSKGEDITVPWSVFNPNGAIKIAREDNAVLWDLASRVQRRAEAERQNSGNAIVSFNAKLNIKADVLSATVKTNGMSRKRCPVMDQLAEALSYLGNVQKVAREIFDREEAERSADRMAEERREVKDMDDERKAVAAAEKARLEAEKAAALAAKEKAQKAVKDAFTKKPDAEGNGEPVAEPVAA